MLSCRRCYRRTVLLAFGLNGGMFKTRQKKDTTTLKNVTLLKFKQTEEKNHRGSEANQQVAGVPVCSGEVDHVSRHLHPSSGPWITTEHEVCCRQRTAAVCRNGFSEEQPRRPRISTRAASMSLQLTAVEKQSEGGPTASILFSLLGSLKGRSRRAALQRRAQAWPWKLDIFDHLFSRAVNERAHRFSGERCCHVLTQAAAPSANSTRPTCLCPGGRICFGNKSMYALVYTFACHLRPPHPTCCKRDVFLENGGTCSQATKCLPHCR